MTTLPAKQFRNDAFFKLDDEEFLDHWRSLNEFTVLIWFQIANNDAPGVHHWFLDGDWPHRRISIYETQDGDVTNIAFQMRLRDGVIISETVNDKHSDHKFRNRPLLIAAGMDRETVRLTINGAEVWREFEREEDRAVREASGPLTIGRKTAGLLQSVEMVDRLLTGEEIQEEYGLGTRGAGEHSGDGYFAAPYFVDWQLIEHSAPDPEFRMQPIVDIPKIDEPPKSDVLVGTWSSGDQTCLDADPGLNPITQLRHWAEGKPVMPSAVFGPWWTDNPHQRALERRANHPLLDAVVKTNAPVSIVTMQPEGWFRSLSTTHFGAAFSGPWVVDWQGRPLNNDVLHPLAPQEPWTKCGEGLARSEWWQWVQRQLEGHEGPVYLVSNNEIQRAECKRGNVYKDGWLRRANWQGTDQDMSNLWVKGWRRCYRAMWMAFRAELPDELNRRLEIVGFNGNVIPMGSSPTPSTPVNSDGELWMTPDSGFDGLSLNINGAVSHAGTVLSPVYLRQNYLTKWWKATNYLTAEISTWAADPDKYPSAAYEGYIKLYLLATGATRVREFRDHVDKLSEFGAHLAASYRAAMAVQSGQLREFWSEGELIKTASGSVFLVAGVERALRDGEMTVIAIALRVENRVLVYAFCEASESVRDVIVAVPGVGKVRFDLVLQSGSYQIATVADHGVINLNTK